MVVLLLPNNHQRSQERITRSLLLPPDQLQLILPVSVESDEDEELVALKRRLAAYNLDSSPEMSAMETETVPEAAIAKEGPVKRAGAARKAQVSEDGAAYNLDSSPEMSAMETETVLEAAIAKEGPVKRAGAARKAQVSEDDTYDEVFENGRVPRGKKGGGGGRKPTNARKAKATTVTKKREETKPVLSQKLVSELLPPATNAVNSPEKKVRKIRSSPFNKKSGSFLNKSGINGSSSEDSSYGASVEAQLEDGIARARPKRENRTRTVYVESGSEEDEEEENEVLSEFSDFEGEDDD